MKTDTKFIRSDRRLFLKGAAVASAATVVAPAVVQAGETEVAPATTPAVEHKGYQENEYIRSYYDRARF